MYVNCLKITRDTKLQWFQYRLINRILPIKTYMYLKKVGLLENDLCSLCGELNENIQHVFFYCNKSKNLWFRLEQFIYDKINKDIVFNLKDILFGLPSDAFNPVNFIVLVSKVYIYLCCKRGDDLNIFALLNFINKKYNVEKNMQFHNFSKKWSEWSNIFD